MTKANHDHRLFTILIVFILGYISGCASYKNKDYLFRMFDEKKMSEQCITSDIRDKSVLKGLKYIWEYQEDFAYRHKRLPDSISEMGDGTQIGRTGIITRRHIWEARYDSENPKPDPDTENRYCYFTVRASSTTATNISAIIAIPENKTNAYLVAVCGPFDLKDPLTFKRKAKIFKLSADFEKFLGKMISTPSISLDDLDNCLNTGTKKKFIYDGFFALDKK